MPPSSPGAGQAQDAPDAVSAFDPFNRHAGLITDGIGLDPIILQPAPILPRGPWSFLWYLLTTTAPRRVLVLFALGLMAAAIEAFAPFLLKEVVNGLAAVAGGTGNALITAKIWQDFLLLVVVWLSAPALFRLFEILDIYTSPTIRERAQNLLFGYLLGHSPRYFQDNFAGKLGQKIKQAGQATLPLTHIVGHEILRIIVMLAVGAGLLANSHSNYAAILCVWTAVFLGVSALLAKRLFRLSRAFSEENAASSGKIIDTITNAETVRAFAKAAFERRLIAAAVGRERRASRKLRWFYVVMWTFQMVMMTGLLGGLVGLGVSDVLAGAMSLGAFTMIFTLATILSNNVQGLSMRMLDFFEQLGTLTEAIHLVTAPHEITDRAGAKPLEVTAGAIALQNVTFRHADGTAVFENLSLDIKPGEKIALVGRSGAGKSTLVKLIRRQYEPQEGTITIDGQEIRDVTWDSLNAAISEVPQFPGVFHRPVRDNIRYSRAEAAEEEVISAAKTAHAHEFIIRRPTGYDTMVGEQGVKLSGGERQRVAIARALVKDARILVLDEATSSLDSESEHLIQDALFKLMEGRTVIAIAHRLSTIREMDRIIVLESGRIVEQGNHDALLAHNGAYARLWQRQVGGFLEVAE